MTGSRTRVLAIVGATTSGKTDLSLEVARQLNGEIVSMDSRQVYRGMDIGTDKVSLPERALVPHHGLDLVDPDERYSAGRFGRDARVWIRSIAARRRVPILVGGTGFFLKALLDPIFDEPDLDPDRRAALGTWMSERTLEELGRWCVALDPERAPLASEGGRQRLQRTLEVALLSGRPLSEWHRTARVPAPDYDTTVVWLRVPREVLDANIDARVEGMMERGLMEEVEALATAGFRREDPGMSGTGYREMWDVREGRLLLPDAKERMKAQTRQYARRQLTWFRNQLPPDRGEVDATAPRASRVARVLELWDREGRAA